MLRITNPDLYLSTLNEVVSDALKGKICEDQDIKDTSLYIMRTKLGPAVSKLISDEFYSQNTLGIAFNVFVVDPMVNGEENTCDLTPYTCGNRPANDASSLYISYIKENTMSASVLVQSDWLDSIHKTYYALLGVYDQFLSIFFCTLEDRAVPSLMLSLHSMHSAGLLPGGSKSLDTIPIPPYIRKAELYKNIKQRKGKIFESVEECFYMYKRSYYKKFM